MEFLHGVSTWEWADGGGEMGGARWGWGEGRVERGVGRGGEGLQPPTSQWVGGSGLRAM